MEFHQLKYLIQYKRYAQCFFYYFEIIRCDYNHSLNRINLTNESKKETEILMTNLLLALDADHKLDYTFSISPIFFEDRHNSIFFCLIQNVEFIFYAPIYVLLDFFQ